jgi:hypothetical protein
METQGESGIAGSRALRSDAVNRRDDLISGPANGQFRTADEGFVREDGVGGGSSSKGRPSGTWEVSRSDDGRVGGPVLGTPPYRRDVIMRDQKRKPSAKSKTSSGSFDVSVSCISVPVNCKLTTAFMNMLISLHLLRPQPPSSALFTESRFISFLQSKTSASPEWAPTSVLTRHLLFLTT